MLESGRFKRLLLFCIVLVGAGLRLYKWNGYSLWYDEAIWTYIGTGDFLHSVTLTVGISKPPLFRILLYFWSFLGQGEFVLRLLPAIIGMASIIVVYKLGAILFDEKVGLFAAFLICISPFHIYYSQELTNYSLTMFLALCSVYYLVLSLDRNKISFWIKFIFFTTLSIYNSYLCAFLIIAQNIFFLFSYRKYKSLTKRWFFSQLAILLLYSPWLILLPNQFLVLLFQQDYLDWVPKGSLAHIFQTIRLFNAGYNAAFPVHLFALLLFTPLLLVGIFHNLKKNWQKIKLLLIWFFLPLILSLIFSKIQATFTYRNFIFILPAYYFLIALGMARLKQYLYIALLSFIVVSSFSLYNYYQDILPYPEGFYRPGVHKKIDNRGSTAYIASNFQEGDVVMHTCRSTLRPYLYYLFVLNHKNIDKINNLFFNSFHLPEEEKSFTDLAYKGFQWESGLTIKSAEEASKFITPGSRRVWLVFSSWEPQSLFADPSMEEYKVKKWLDDNFIMTSYNEFEGIKVYLYKIPHN